MVEINIFRHSQDAESVAGGSVLFREGEPGDAMFAVVDGDVELTHNGKVIETVGAGGIVGEMALIDAAPRSATATVRSDARVVRVDQKRFTFLLHEHPTFAVQVMAIMADRLRRANDGGSPAAS